MTRARLILANLGVVAGWATADNLKDGAQIVAWLATAVWAAAQTWYLIRRQRCTVPNCHKRKS